MPFLNSKKDLTEDSVLNALKAIMDPDFNKDIVSLGFVKNIHIAGKDVSFDIELTTPACPVKSEFQKQAEESIKKLGASRVSVQMTSKPVSKPSVAPNIPSTLATVRSIIAVSSCKGGVGKSTVAACLAKELAQRGFKVGLLDADIHGPSVPSLFNLYQVPMYTNEKNYIIPIEAGNLKIMSFGFLLGDAPAVMRGPILTRYIQQLLHQTAWGDLDYLFIDMPPGTGDVQLTITQTVQLSGAVIVTTRQTLSLVDVARGILMFEEVKVPILGIIENMAYFICDKCEKKHYIFGGKETDTLKDRFGLETLAQLPILPELGGKFDKEFHNDYIKEAVDKVVMALGKTSIDAKQAPKIQFDEKEIRLEWAGGERLSVRNRDLRVSCRCAVCVNEMTGELLLDEKQIPADIKAKEVTALGNYALGVKWSDGHSSGIYPYETIKKLALK